MTSYPYREKWNNLKKQNNCSPETLNRLARQVAYSFLDRYLKDYHYEEEYIDLLCEMTTFFNQSQLNLPGAQALFGIIIETLCDDFEELQTITYNKVMAQIISYCRSIPAGETLDQKLFEFGIYSRPELVQRIQSIREEEKRVPSPSKIEKIIILSRVTIGADVAITSIVIQRFKKLFPSAEIVLIGRENLKQIYGENKDIFIRNVPYSKKGDLLSRLSSWHLVLEIIQNELESCNANNTILVDTDSRLSQLGVLPLFSRERYYFFDSRSDKSFMNKMSMPELVNNWLNQILMETDFSYPQVWIPKDYMEYAKNYTQTLYQNGAKSIVVLNFGYGGNLRKRVGISFEVQLVLTLLQEPNTLVLVDQGLGAEEAANTEMLLQEVNKHGYPIEESVFGQDQLSNLNWGVVGIQSQVGEIASLIACSDEFIGYDSACQHIAAALKTPCITIFAGSNNMRFIRRWSAYGQNSSQIVHVDTLNSPSGIDTNDLITRVMHQRYSRQGQEIKSRIELI